MSRFYDRYCAGEHVAVWHELTALGASACEPDIVDDAWAVAQETMRRARQNVQTIVQRLRALDYQFRPDPRVTTGEPIVSPPADLSQTVSDIENRWGPIPLSIRAWWEIVGGVNLMGRHPDLPPYSDPLVVELPDIDYFAECFECMDEPEIFPMPMAPDYYHKDNVSGAGEYAIALPNRTVDAIFKGEWYKLVGLPKSMCFVDYLRITFRFGGFPGFAKHRVSDGFAALPNGLLPI